MRSELEQKYLLALRIIQKLSGQCNIAINKYEYAFLKKEMGSEIVQLIRISMKKRLI